MATILTLLPGLEGEEQAFVQSLANGMTDEQVQVFAATYGAQRTSPLMILGLCCGGFVGIAGIHRFVTGRTGLGAVYFLTLGFVGIGTLLDLINHNKIAWEYNLPVAQRAAILAKAA